MRVPRLLLRVLIGAVILGIPAAYTRDAAARTQSQIAVCNSIANVYATDRATLKVCGYQVFPLDHVETLADGTSAYIYLVGGHSLLHYVPPAGTNFANASSELLDRFGLPQRPTDSAALAAWQAKMSAVRFMPATPFVVANPQLNMTIKPLTDHQWSGYMNNPPPSGVYTDSYIDYYEPGTTAGYCGSDALAVWSGLGGWGNNDLGQAGTLPEANGVANHQAWLYVLPDMTGQGVFYENWRATPGDDVTIDVKWLSSNGQYSFHLDDWTRGYHSLEAWGSANFSGRSSEYIVERPTVNKVIPPVAKFGSVTVNAAQAAVNGGSRLGMQNYQENSIAMTNSAGTVLVTPTANPTGQTFNDYWQRCS